MANDPFLGMLGLARRAGKLAFGDELVREACADKKARCVFVAADAGASTAKKAAFYAAGANVPLVTLPHGKDDLGAAIGKNGCAVCAVSDIGLAAAAVDKLAAQHPEYAAVAAQLTEKNARIQSRRGKKKPRDRQAQTAEQAAEQPQRRPRGGRRQPSKRTAQHRRQTSDAHGRQQPSRQFSQHRRQTPARNGRPRFLAAQTERKPTRKARMQIGKPCKAVFAIKTGGMYRGFDTRKQFCVPHSDLQNCA